MLSLAHGPRFGPPCFIPGQKNKITKKKLTRLQLFLNFVSQLIYFLVHNKITLMKMMP